MRMLMRIQVPTEDGNRAIQEGTLPTVLEKAMDELKPEAAYFVADEGKRTFYWFLDMEDQSDLPWVAERFFTGLNAEVQTTPAMTFEDVQKGLAKAFGQDLYGRIAGLDAEIAARLDAVEAEPEGRSVHERVTG